MSEALSDILRRLTPAEPLAPPNFTILKRACARIVDDFGQGARRSVDPELQLAAFQQRMHKDDWKGLPLSTVMEVGEHAFSGSFRDDPAFDDVRRFYLAEIPASDRPGFLVTMTRIYIETFDAAAAHTLALAEGLSRVADRIGAQWRKVLQAFPSLFDPSRIVAEIAERMLSLPDIWNGLRNLGLRQPHAPGLMVQAHLAFLSRVEPRLTDQGEIERVLAWLKPPGQAALATGAAETVTALLRPWRATGIPDTLKRYLIDRLLDLFGHPKVNRNAVWDLVPSELEGMFLHWLTGADIRMLFSVLNEVERGHMWADREAFWWDLYEQGMIDEVWVAFNHEGYRVAQSRLPRDQRHGSAHLRFGLQAGEKDKSLLIMRIGKKIVVEGTYNFKVHTFDAQSQQAPKLYRRKYDVSDIRYAGRRHAETVPHLGGWQRRVRGGLSS